MSEEKFSPQLDPSAYYKAGNTGLKNWQALNEIIANSIDSWIDTGLKKDLIVKIDLNNLQTNLTDSSIRVTDNASGMEKEQLINLFSFFKSTKSSSKLAEQYLGLYGFGFKAATSKIGTNITVIIPNSNNFIYNNNFRLSWIIKDMKCSQNLDYPTVYEPQFSRSEVTCNY